MMQAQCSRLRTQSAARTQPAKQRARARHFGNQLIPQRAQVDDRGARVGAVVGEGSVNAAGAQLGGDESDLARWHVQHEADLALAGRHALERVYAEEQARKCRDLVGGHQPGADGQDQHELSDERHHPQSP